MKPPAALKKTPYTVTQQADRGDGPVAVGAPYPSKGLWLPAETETRTRDADTKHAAGELMVWADVPVTLGAKVSLGGLDYTVLSIEPALDPGGRLMYSWVRLG